MTKDNGEGPAKRPLSVSEDATGTDTVPPRATRGRPRANAGAPKTKGADAPKKEKAPAAAKTAAGRGGRKSAMDSEAPRSEEDDEERSRDDSDEDADEREDGDEPVDADGDVIDVAGEIVDEEMSADTDVPAKPANRAFKSETPADHDDSVALSRTDPLQAYLREVQRHKLLTPDEEKELTQKFEKTQDPRTAARLVTANLRLVVKLAYEYRRAYKNIMDLIQEGNIGLMQAVKRYDPYRGVKLSSYAAWWIRAYILRFILNNWRLVKLGTTQAQRKLFFNLNKEKAKLAAMGIEPEAAEIAKRLGVEEKEVIDMDRRLSSGEASLDAPVGDSDGRAVSRLDMMPSMSSGPDVAFEQEEMGQLVKERLQEFRKTLKGKDVIIFDKRMAADEPLTLQELGDEFGISRERVRQLEARLTHKLRIYLKQEFGDAVDAS
ncbi:MAG: RNA polymerase factor sigma-32 [Polyangiaceae bacterium]